MGKRGLYFLVCFILIFEMVVPAGATTISSVRNQRNQTQANLNEVNTSISQIESQRESVNSELEIMNDQLVEILTSIEILEEEISLKQKEINMAQKDLNSAQELETKQYEDMKKRIKFMYEQGDSVYVQALIGAVNYSDMMNKAEYMEQIYSYDRELLAEYVENRQEIEDLKLTLEEEQAAMKTSEYELSEERDSLEILVALKRRTVEDFDAQLADARQKASAYKAQLKQQTQRIKQMEEEKRKKEEEERKKREEEEAAAEEGGEEGNGDGDGGDGGTTTIDVTEEDNGPEGGEEEDGDDDFNAGAGDDIDYDSSLGQQICDYAAQFVGNPYVYGGTSLTDGADCSGFTQSVFAAFGYSLPRDSFSQRSCGVAVAYEDAQPGDLICYAGHVALYIGDGQIIHASTERTGICYGYATYRTILAVRRVI